MGSAICFAVVSGVFMVVAIAIGASEFAYMYFGGMFYSAAIAVNGLVTVAVFCVSPDDVREDAIKAGVAEYVTGEHGEPFWRS